MNDQSHLPLLELPALPPRLAERIGRLEAARSELWRYRMTPAGIRLDLADAGGAFFPDTYGARFKSVRRGRALLAFALMLPLLAGTGVAFMCVLSLAGMPKHPGPLFQHAQGDHGMLDLAQIFDARPQPHVILPARDSAEAGHRRDQRVPSSC